MRLASDRPLVTAYYNGRDVTETEPSEVGAIVLRVRPCVALQMARSIILWEEPYMRFERLMCLARRDDYLGELALSKLTRAVFGINDEARDLANFFGFTRGSREAELTVERCTEHLAEYEEYLTEEETRDSTLEDDSVTEADASEGKGTRRSETPKDAIERGLSGEKASL